MSTRSFTVTSNDSVDEGLARLRAELASHHVPRLAGRVTPEAVYLYRMRVPGAAKRWARFTGVLRRVDHQTVLEGVIHVGRPPLVILVFSVAFLAWQTLQILYEIGFEQAGWRGWLWLLGLIVLACLLRLFWSLQARSFAVNARAEAELLGQTIERVLEGV